jgi:hypothetical protein
MSISQSFIAQWLIHVASALTLEIPHASQNGGLYASYDSKNELRLFFCKTLTTISVIIVSA